MAVPTARHEYTSQDMNTPLRGYMNGGIEVARALWMISMGTLGGRQPTVRYSTKMDQHSRGTKKG